MLIVLLVHWVGFITGEPVKVTVSVFSDYLMPCNISELPAKPQLTDFLWFQNYSYNRGLSEFLQPRGGIPFKQISPSAGDIYRCCYNGSDKVVCSEEIHLFVKGKRFEVNDESGCLISMV